MGRLIYVESDQAIVSALLLQSEAKLIFKKTAIFS